MTGPSAPMRDARERVVGTIPLVLDLTIDGMLHAKVVRSVVPHATITAIDTADALALPGVVAVITGADLAALPIEPTFGAMRRDQPVLAIGKVRYAGEPVAIVVAAEDWQARAAAQAVWVDYDELGVVIDEEEALAPGAPQLHDAHPGNECGDWSMVLGDPDTAMASAARVFEGVYRTPGANHVPMEPHVGVARWTDGRLEVWSSTQSPYQVKRALTGIFGTEDVRVHVLEVGGGYGAKGQVRIEPMVACAALVVGRPVRIELDRAEVFATCGRHAAVVRMRTGVDTDGRIVAREVDAIYNAGAYSVTTAYATGQAMVRAPGPYAIPNVRVRARGSYTNTVPTGPFRGAMTGQVCFAYESQLDEIADALGIDRVEVRRRNVIRDGDVYLTGEHLHDLHVDELLEGVAEALDWSTPLPPTAPGSTRRRGRGLGLTMKSTLTPTRSEARLVLDADGYVTLHCASVEMGQGATATLTHLTARALDLDPSRVHRPAIDTDEDPFDAHTGSSRTTSSMGAAIQDAAARLRARAEEAHRGAGHGDVAEHRDGGTVDRDGTWRGYPEVLGLAGAATAEEVGVFQSAGGLGPDGRATADGPVSIHWHQGAAGVEVEVDVETGRVEVLRAVGACYAGRVLDRTRVDQQNAGCVIMGLGTALFEALTYDDGQLTNPNLSDYMVPSMLDVPRDLRSVVIESSDPDAEVHGVGEMAIPPVAPAVASAIHDAVGVWVRTLPLTPERVLRALEEQGGSAPGVGRQEGAGR